MIQISDLWIGKMIIDCENRRLCRVTDLTSNSVEVHLTALTDKGIDCLQYFSIKNLNSRFAIATLDDVIEITKEYLFERIDRNYERLKNKSNETNKLFI